MKWRGERQDPADLPRLRYRAGSPRPRGGGASIYTLCLHDCTVHPFAVQHLKKATCFLTVLYVKSLVRERRDIYIYISYQADLLLCFVHEKVLTQQNTLDHSV